MLLVRVDPSIFPANSNAVAMLLRAESVWKQAIDETLSGDLWAANLTPAEGGQEDLFLFEIRVDLDGSNLATKPHSLDEGNAFIRKVAEKVNNRLLSLMNLKRELLKENHRSRKKLAHDLQQVIVRIESHVAALEQRATHEDFLRHQRAQQESLIALTALESQRTAIINAIDKAKNAEPSREQASIGDKLREVTEALRARLAHVEDQVSRGNARPIDAELIRGELVQSEAEYLRWDQAVREKNFDTPFFQKQLIQTSIKQAELHALAAAHEEQAESARIALKLVQQERDEHRLKLQRLRSERDEYANEESSAFRQLQAITQPEVQIIQ